MDLYIPLFTYMRKRMKLKKKVKKASKNQKIISFFFIPIPLFFDERNIYHWIKRLLTHNNTEYGVINKMKLVTYWWVQKINARTSENLQCTRFFSAMRIVTSWILSRSFGFRCLPFLCPLYFIL
jgi:hypothetical protein